MTAPLFTFAVIADTHINPKDGESGSPWRSNALANDRARWAVAALKGDRPDFVLHLGDMVHPLPSQAGYPVAAERFRTIFDGLRAPLHTLPGNHDIGDKPGDWMPAHPVTAADIETFRKTFGALWSVFDHDGCRFILHCNPILGSGLPEDAEQWGWLEEQLATAGGMRVFFMTHYPLFLTDAEEPEHYDNLAPPARERLRALLVSHGVEAVFAAHVHTTFHTPLAKSDDAPFQHVVPTTSALRLDYSHLFPTPPLPDHEHGRNDARKLGYLLVDVLETGYRIRLRRTDGATLTAGKAGFTPGALRCYSEPLAARPIGVDLRQGWAHTCAIPYSGVVDEFRRKYVRNDYLLTALQEAGLRDLRAPIDDLLDETCRARMSDFGRFGHTFQLFTIDPPTPAAAGLLRQSAGLVSRLEVIARPQGLAARLADWRRVLDGTSIQLIASRMWSSADLPTEAVHFAHAIGQGFLPEDHTLLAMADAAADGVMIRIGPDASPKDAIARLPDGLTGQQIFYLCLSANDPALAAEDDAVQDSRVRAALAVMARHTGAPILILDTLTDHDRGYYPRHGAYDARFNPRRLALSLSQMNISAGA